MKNMLYQPYKWFFAFPSLVLSTIFFSVLSIILAKLVNPKTGRVVGGTAWAKFIGVITPMQVTVHGLEHIDRRQSYVIASNHQSHFDILVIYGWMGIDPMWVMKQELRKIPIFGLACEKVGMIFIDRSNTETAVRSLKTAKTRVVNGSSVIFFPEGTRSRDGNLRPFKKGAFKMALDLELPILPVTILGTRNILPPDSLSLFPGRVEMTIHPPVDISGYTGETLPGLMEAIRRQILSPMPPSSKGLSNGLEE
ncbi:MAG: 1-acyl-sn-glycerol-3-phosphate acyltransferase [Desulfobacterales bacterium]|nr:1-acyl-sn-glycerol-3-phosphate acyltransferase [Desulfobacterales bacterium]